MGQVVQLVGLASGFLLALALWVRRSRPVEPALVRLLLGAPLIFVGGKALYLLQHGGWGKEALTGPGYSGFGALFLVLTFWIVSFRFQPGPLFEFLDVVTPAAAVGLFFGRISCFLRGCCGGVACDLPWAVEFPPNTPLFAWQLAQGFVHPWSRSTLPVHPVQLYEAAFALLAGVGLLLLLTRKQLPPGRVFFCGALGYGVFRFFIEELRFDGGRLLSQGEGSWAQFMALGLALVGLAGVLLPVRKPQFGFPLHAQETEFAFQSASPSQANRTDRRVCTSSETDTVRSRVSAEDGSLPAR